MELETIRDVWHDVAADDPRKTHSNERGWSYCRKVPVRTLIEEALAQMVE